MIPWSLLWKGALVVVGLMAVLPPRIRSLGPDPHPATSFAQATESAAVREAVDDTAAAPGGATILLSHGHPTKRVFVLFHGMTDSPRQFLPLAEELFAAGDNVYIPRLPRHATREGNPRILDGLRAEELRDCADSAVDIGVGLGDSVIVMGLSIGGTMAAWVAQYRSDVKRVVLISPALEFGKVPSVVEEHVVDLTLRVPGVTRRSAPDSLSPDREPAFDTRALAQSFRLAVAVRNQAAKTAPAVPEAEILINAHDRTVKNATTVDLAHRWQMKGMRVTIYELPDSLRLPHDVVDAAKRGGGPEIVLPVTQALALGGTLPPWLVRVTPVAAQDTTAQIH